MPKDPICRRSVEKILPLSLEIDNKRFYFCSPNCLRIFKNNPRRYRRRLENEHYDEE